MEMLSNIQRRMLFDHVSGSNNDSKLNRLGTGGNPLSLPLVGDVITPPHSEQDAAGSEGYAIRLGSNAETRLYSSGIARLSERIGNQQMLESGLSRLTDVATEIEQVLSPGADEGSHPDPAEWIALATDYYDAARSVRTTLAAPMFTKDRRVDFGSRPETRRLMQDTVREATARRSELRDNLRAAADEIGALLESMELVPANDPEEGPPLRGIEGAVVIGQRIAGDPRGMTDAQAHIDPHLAVELLKP